MLLVALALCVRALLPAGYMPQAGGRLLSVAICADTQGLHLTRQITLPTRPEAGEHAPGHSCTLCALAHAPMAGGGDVALPAAPAPARAALAQGGGAGWRLAAPLRLRPPLRAPPILA